MSAKYKTVRNGRGTCLVAAFDSWEAFLGALDMSGASYVREP